MTTEPPKELPLAEGTTPGNYFISNYPPYSFWTPEHVNDAYQALDRRASARNAARHLSSYPVLPEALSLLLFQGIHRQTVRRN